MGSFQLKHERLESSLVFLLITQERKSNELGKGLWRGEGIAISKMNTGFNLYSNITASYRKRTVMFLF